MRGLQVTVDNSPLRMTRSGQTLVEAAAKKLREVLGHDPLGPGAQLPSETELAQVMQVSRTTLRSAIRTLELEGIVFRRPGIGTFVSRSPVLAYDLGRLSDLSHLIRSMGHRPGLRILGAEVVRAEHHVAEKLDLASGAPVVRLERVRTADGKPVVHHLEFFARSHLDRSKPPVSVSHLPDLLGGSGSFLEAFEQLVGIHLIGAQDVLWPVLCDRDIADKLEVRPDTPLLRVEEVAHDRRHRPVLLSLEYHVAELCKFSIHRNV